jgi:hypothetical protein
MCQTDIDLEVSGGVRSCRGRRGAVLRRTFAGVLRLQSRASALEQPLNGGEGLLTSGGGSMMVAETNSLFHFLCERHCVGVKQSDFGSHCFRDGMDVDG